MGALTSRQNDRAEEVDVASVHAYKYPPKSGNYFGSHFIMGGERFDTPQPEAYLFGENADLNFLGSRPTPFPYPPPQASEPTKILKSWVNIRKESLRMVKAVQSLDKGESEAGKQTHFNIEFMFDCDCRTSITIYYLAFEEMTPNGVTYVSKHPSLTSETFHYGTGANQVFCQPSHTFDPTKYSDEDLSYVSEKEIAPVAVHCVARDSSEDKQSHTTIAVIERHSDGTYVMKALKQKIFVDGLCYLLQEIYGIENKNGENMKMSGSDLEAEDNGSECVICMSDVRDTLILPCRHLCLCNSCADSLRYQASNCPICRAPFRALLQIKALRKSTDGPPPEGCEHIPPGYESVSLIEALNGPCLRVRTTPPQTTPESEPAGRRSRKSLESPDYEESIPPSEVRMSVLLQKEDEMKEEVKKNDRRKSRDSGGPNREDSVEDEVDSEAEKLSPLLSGEEISGRKKRWEGGGDDKKWRSRHEGEGCSAPAGSGSNHLLHAKTSGGHTGSGQQAEDSDYYTPEDPSTTILSPLHSISDKEAIV